MGRRCDGCRSARQSLTRNDWAPVDAPWMDWPRRLGRCVVGRCQPSDRPGSGDAASDLLDQRLYVMGWAWALGRLTRTAACNWGFPGRRPGRGQATPTALVYDVTFFSSTGLASRSEGTGDVLLCRLLPDPAHDFDAMFSACSAAADPLCFSGTLSSSRSSAARQLDKLEGQRRLGRLGTPRCGGSTGTGPCEAVYDAELHGRRWSWPSYRAGNVIDLSSTCGRSGSDMLWLSTDALRTSTSRAHC